jgi:GLPGLI family protein
MKNILFLLLVLVSSGLIAQTPVFIEEGSIEFELKRNQHKQLDDEESEEEESEWVKSLKKEMPKFVTETFVMHFNKDKSIYKLAKENEKNKYLWGGKPSEDDKCVTDFNTQTQQFQKEVYEKTYLITDSFRQLQWKITDETREIAGFECKKAVTKICDSVYIVAFYTEQITVNGGPESFNGLPGMILGLAVPRLATTWYATSVTPGPQTAQLSKVKTKGKVATWKNFEADLKKAMSDWGKWGTRRLWAYML